MIEKKSPAKRKQKSTRIDMTAMVDVAFLLLTFFVLTATLNKARVMEIIKPPQCPPGTENCTVDIAEEKILTLVLDKDDKIQYYHGLKVEAVEETDYSSNGLRKVLSSHLNRYPDLCKGKTDRKNCWDPIFVIKPKNVARYKNLVDVLDEIAILDIQKYVIDKYEKSDSLILSKAIAQKL